MSHVNRMLPFHTAFYKSANTNSGDLVPLGALSVFESLGGILSANLPVTYVLFANFIRDLKKIFSSIISTKLKPHEPHFHDPAMFHTGRTINAGAKQWIQLPASSYSVDSKPSDLSDTILKNNSHSRDNGNSDFLIIEKGCH